MRVCLCVCVSQFVRLQVFMDLIYSDTLRGSLDACCQNRRGLF